MEQLVMKVLINFEFQCVSKMVNVDSQN